MAKKVPRLISKKVEVLDCKCSWDGKKQAGFHRYDSCVCKVRTTKGKKRTVVPLPGKYNIGTIFVK